MLKCFHGLYYAGVLGSAPPTGHLKPAPTTKLDNKKPIQADGSKPLELAGCNSSHPTQENKPPLSKSAVKSHVKRHRIADFVLHRPSSPSALSPNPSNNLAKDSVQTTSPKQNHNQLPMTERLSTTVTAGGFTSSTPIQECGFFPRFYLTR